MSNLTEKKYRGTEYFPPDESRDILYIQMLTGHSNITFDDGSKYPPFTTGERNKLGFTVETDGDYIVKMG